MPAGNYEAVITLPDGKKTSKKFTLKAAAARSFNFEPEPGEEEEF